MPQDEHQKARRRNRRLKRVKAQMRAAKIDYYTGLPPVTNTPRKVRNRNA